MLHCPATQSTDLDLLPPRLIANARKDRMEGGKQQCECNAESNIFKTGGTARSQELTTETEQCEEAHDDIEHEDNIRGGTAWTWLYTKHNSPGQATNLLLARGGEI